MKLVRNGSSLSASEINEFVRSYRDGMLTAGSRYFEMLRMVPQSSLNVLDFGSGWGGFSKILADKGHRVTGIDLSMNEIEIAQHVWGNENPKFLSARIGDLPEQSFDLVVSQQVIEHTHNPGNYLSQINRVLRAGGRLLISLPNIANPRFFINPIAHRQSLEAALIALSERVDICYDKAHDHIQAWDPEHFVRLVTTVGFRLERFRPMERTPLPFFLRRLKLPAYISLPGRFKNWCYTMGFLFCKTRSVEIDMDD